MRGAKSEPKLKNSLSKYPNFFTDKKWDEPMYMDDRNAESSEIIKAIASYSSMTIQPKAKLSLSLHEKVGVVLADSHKIGMIEKVENAATRKSLAKISYVSTLPPIKTQVQQTEEYLRKLKNELNQVSLNSIRISKEVSNLQASINQSKQKSRVLQEILGRTGEKEMKQINDRKEVTQELKYNYDVRLHMHENLKTDIRALAKCKHVLEQRLKALKIEVSSLATQLNNGMASLNNNIDTKREYKQKQELASEEIMWKSEIAQNKLIHERNAERIHHKIEALKGYDKDQFNFDTNLQHHFAALKELRAQQVLNKMMDCLHHKYQVHWQDYEKSYRLMKMYSQINKGVGNQSNPSSTGNKLLRSSSLKGNSSKLSETGDGEIDLSMTYDSSFGYKKQLYSLIKEKEQTLKQLEDKKQKLYNVWVSKIFEDSVTQGAKVAAKNMDYSRQMKLLVETDKRAQKNKLTQLEIEMWVVRQEERLSLVFSKKMSTSDKIVKVIEYLREQCESIKNIELKPSKPVQMPAKVAGSKTKK